MKTLAPSIATMPVRMASMQPGSWRPTNASSTARGYGYAWQQARLRFLRAHPICEYCQAKGDTTVATVVDHRIPHRGDQKLFWDKENNWVASCEHCHNSDKQRLERAGQT